MHALNRLRVYLLVLHKGWQWKDPAPNGGVHASGSQPQHAAAATLYTSLSLVM